MGVDFGDVDEVIRAGGRGLKELEEVDRRKAVSLLARWWIEEVPSWKAILQKMLFWGYKAEIEVLGEMLEEWVENGFGFVSNIYILITICCWRLIVPLLRRPSIVFLPSIPTTPPAPPCSSGPVSEIRPPMPLQCRTLLRATAWPCLNPSSLGSAYNITCVAAAPSLPSKTGASHSLLVFSATTGPASFCRHCPVQPRPGGLSHGGGLPPSSKRLAPPTPKPLMASPSPLVSTRHSTGRGHRTLPWQLRLPLSREISGHGLAKKAAEPARGKLAPAKNMTIDCFVRDHGEAAPPCEAVDIQPAIGRAPY
jgi:hypothetical protein